MTWRTWEEYIGDYDPGDGGGGGDPPPPDDPPTPNTPPPQDPDDPYTAPPPADPIPIYETVEVYQWQASGDACPVCNGLDGTTWEGDDGPRPPAHINCRCSAVVIERYERLIGFEEPRDLGEIIRGLLPNRR